MLYRLLACCLCVSAFLACSPEERNLRNYYFPAEQLRGGMVYEYLSEQGDSVVTEYWYYRSFLRDSGLFLAGTYYDEHFRIGQIVREKMAESGAVAREYFLYDSDAPDGRQRQIPTVLRSGQVFPFAVRDSAAVSLFDLSYSPPDEPGTTLRVLRERRFLGNAPDFVFRGGKVRCVRFSLRETIGGDDEAGPPLEGRGEEHYALGLGRVYYRKSYGSGEAVQFEYRLHDVFPMAELERRAGVGSE
ncbi:MAG TPA: hypothetical protein PK971_14750 [Saprospiraceae bacterium]|nr:hypothetical protein [Saprospiraceae bacterium]HND89589.1 hypothetical protein [Saprospiraceae bacterium]